MTAEAEKLAERLEADLKPYADKPVGSLRIDMDEVRAILAVITLLRQLERERDEARDDTFIHREALHDLVQLQAEREALNGGGPGWSARWAKALANAEELVRVEP